MYYIIFTCDILVVPSSDVAKLFDDFVSVWLGEII